jgi:hypothetical protein
MRHIIANQQSQFPARIPHHSSILLFHHSPPMPVVRSKPNLHPRRGIGGASPTLYVGWIAPNKPNSARPTGRPGCRKAKMCETNPIAPEGVGRGRPTHEDPPRPSVRNKPNSARLAGGPGRRGVKMGETSPIWAAGAGVGMTERTKQSQFAPADRNRWGKPHPTRGLNCVKQTQSGPGPQAGALKGKERGEQSQSRAGAARRAPCARSGGGRIGPPNSIVLGIVSLGAGGRPGVL